MAEQSQPNWPRLLTTAGLGAAITAIAAVAVGVATNSYGSDKARCELAAQMLGDETPNPALDPRLLRRSLEKASRRFDACMEGER